MLLDLVVHQTVIYEYVASYIYMLVYLSNSNHTIEYQDQTDMSAQQPRQLSIIQAPYIKFFY